MESVTLLLSRLSGRHDGEGISGNNTALSSSNGAPTRGEEVELQLSLWAAFVELVIVLCQGGRRWAD